MEITAKSMSIHISPRKVRLIADSLRGKSAEKALQVLSITQKRAAYMLTKTIQSALANAANNAKLVKEAMIIKSITIGQGSALKRFHPSTRGRIHPYKRRTSHITVTLKEVNNGAKN